MALIRLYTVVSRAGDGDAHPASRFPARGPPTGPLVAAVLNSGCIFTRTRYLLGLPRLLLGSPSSRASCLVGLGSCWPLRRHSLSSSSGGPCHMCAMLPPGHIHILVTLIFSSDFLGFFLFMLQTGCFVPSYFAAHRSSRPLWPCSQDVIFFFPGWGGAKFCPSHSWDQVLCVCGSGPLRVRSPVFCKAASSLGSVSSYP